jgi:hypothetical protein
MALAIYETMSSDAGTHQQQRDAWSTIAHHDWDGRETLDVTLGTVLSNLAGFDRDGVLYDYIDVENVVSLLQPHNETRGAHVLRFYCESHEIQVAADGRIKTRQRREGLQTTD